MNNEQRIIADAVIDAVEKKKRVEIPECSCFYIDAPGGCGKTYLMNIIKIRNNNFNVSRAAWTGIAATLLLGDKILHSLFKLPVPLIDTSTCNIFPTSEQAHFLREQDLILIDEASVIPTLAIHAIDKCLQDITYTSTSNTDCNYTIYASNDLISGSISDNIA
jgi:tRNA(Met) C34 N-acetyltransferase TmcA